VINLQTDRIILATFVSVTSVTYYELGNRLARLSMVLPWAVLGVLLPAASAIDGRGDDWQLDLMYVRMTRYLTMAALLMAGFLVGAGHEVLRVWMGRQYPYVIPIMFALLLSYTINGMTGVGTMIVRAIGQPKYETYYALIGASINIAATLILTPLFGVMGVVGGTVIGQVLGSVYFLWIFHRLRGLGWKTPIIDWLWRLVAGTTMGSAALWFACDFLAPASWFASRIRGAAALSILIVIYLAVCGGALRLLRFWGMQDVNLLRETAAPVVARFVKYVAVTS
jgi:O-antigen/teichoic acid export membrane protein